MKPDLTKLKAKIQSLLSSADYRPLRISEVIATLKIPPTQRKQVRQVLDRLLYEGIIVRVRKDRLVIPSQADLITGRLQMNERGFGFLIPERLAHGAETSPDIFIAAEDTAIAMHGDRVVVRLHANSSYISKSRPSSEGKLPRGCVIRVLERGNPTLTGVLQKSSHFYYIAPDDPRIGRDIYVNISTCHPKPRIGDRVVVKLTGWENRHINPEGEIIEIIGPANDPSLDLIVIVKKFRFRTDFPDDVLAQTESIQETISEKDRIGRTDLTEEMVVTIDPEDARDHDDALSLKKLANGHWLLGVHIADVSYYVKPTSPLDREARQRGNSVYLPDRVIPMLPPKLSNGICSLKEGVERLTQSILFELDDHCHIHSYNFCDSIIRSCARLSYPQALSILSTSIKTSQSEAIGKFISADSAAKEKTHIPSRLARTKTLHQEDENLCQLLKNLWFIASQLRAHRFAKGSLDLDFPELKVYCNEKGLAERIEKQENDISHQLVEEFMLLANETAAAETRRRTIPNIYRIHEDPDVEKLEQYRDLVIANGYSMGDPTHRGEIQKLLKRLSGKPEEYILKLNLLRSLKRAQYSTTPVGHFGLAKENYTHFTSPIRRYADLVVHRSLIRATVQTRKANTSRTFQTGTYDITTLESIAIHCSTTERIADEAEKEATKLKLIEYFEHQLKKNAIEDCEALITEVRNFGLFIELPDFMLSGLVHVSTLDDDFYHFDASGQKLIGKRTRRTFQAGHKIRVRVARVDRFKQQVDFCLA